MGLILHNYFYSILQRAELSCIHYIVQGDEDEAHVVSYSHSHKMQFRAEEIKSGLKVSVLYCGLSVGKRESNFRKDRN